MTERLEDFDPEGSPDIDDVDVGAPDQDTAMAEYLTDFPENHRIDEIEDHESLGIDVEDHQEVPEQTPEPTDAVPPIDQRQELSRLLRAEEFADQVRERR